MCTVTFLPTAGGGYLLATNRDERPSRSPARPPEETVLGGRRVLCPVDVDGGGTWVAVNEDGATLCILNGDGAPVAPSDDAAPSRGLLVLELMHDPRPDAVLAVLRRRARTAALRQRPFKLVIVAAGDAGRAARADFLRWDGRDLVPDDAAGARVFVSSTYETDAVTAHRQALFADLLAHGASSAGTDPAATAARLDAWHASHGAQSVHGNAFSVCMHRADAGTVSATRITVDERRVVLAYRAGPPCRGARPVERELSRGASAVR